MEVQNWQNKQISKIQEQQKKTIEVQKHRTHNFFFFFLKCFMKRISSDIESNYSKYCKVLTK